MNRRLVEHMQTVGISIEYLTNTKQLGLIEAFAELVIKDCVYISEQEAAKGKATAESEFVTVGGRQVHQGMWAGAKNCSETIQRLFGVYYE